MARPAAIAATLTLAAPVVLLFSEPSKSWAWLIGLFALDGGTGGSRGLLELGGGGGPARLALFEFGAGTPPNCRLLELGGGGGGPPVGLL